MPTTHTTRAEMTREINVNIEKLDPAVVLAALLNARRGDGLKAPGVQTPDTVKKLFERFRRASGTPVNTMWDSGFLSSIGIYMTLNDDGKTLRATRYNRIYGEGLAEITIDHVNCTKGNDRWRTNHLISYARPASSLSIVLSLLGIAALLSLVFRLSGVS